MPQRADFAVVSDLDRTIRTRKSVRSETRSISDLAAVTGADSSNDFRYNVKQRMSLDAAAAKRNSIDRVTIAGRMSDSTGRDISIHSVAAWLAETRETMNLPLGFANAWATATESTITLEYVMSQHPTLARRLRLGEIAEAVAELEAEKRRIIEEVA